MHACQRSRIKQVWLSWIISFIPVRREFIGDVVTAEGYESKVSVLADEAFFILCKAATSVAKAPHDAQQWRQHFGEVCRCKGLEICFASTLRAVP